LVGDPFGRSAIAASFSWLAADRVGDGIAPSLTRSPEPADPAGLTARARRQENQPVPKVVCPGDLKDKVGTVMYCSLTAQGSTVTYPVKLQVDSTSGTQVHFSIQVSTTPGHFTAPG